MGYWNWLMFSDGGLLARVGVGVAIFAILAGYDLRKNGRAATRWREYAFLVVCVVTAMVYGVVNDLLTSSVSWEYFYYGKGLSSQLGAAVPPDLHEMHLAAAIVGIKATWSAGLLIGVAILLANNPSKSLPRLRNRSLLRLLPLVVAMTMLGAVFGGVAGRLGLPALWNHDFAMMLRRNEMRPERFMIAYGVHLGGYIGGFFAMILAVWRVRRRRRLLNSARLAHVEV
jgi:membrane associated rhomboid family serine protease